MTGHVVSATREVPIPEEEAGPGLADRCLALLTPAPHRVEETRTEVGQLIDRHGQDLVAEVVDALAAGGWSGEYCNRDLRPHVEAALSHGTDNAARRWGADQWITEDETTVRARAQRRYPDRPRLVEAAVGGWRERHDEEAA